MYENKLDLKNLIICSPKVYEQFIRYRKYNKKIEISVYVESDRWYYLNRFSEMRTVFPDGIFQNITDEDGWPTFKLRCIRRFL